MKANQFVHIWFSKNPDIALPMLYQLKIIRHLTNYPSHKIKLIVYKQLLSSTGQAHLANFIQQCNLHFSDRLSVVDLTELSLDEREERLLKIAIRELTDEYGITAAASDIIRFFKSVLKDHIYLDIRWEFDTKTHVKFCFSEDKKVALSGVDKTLIRQHLSQHRTDIIKLLYLDEFLTAEAKQDLEAFKNEFPKNLVAIAIDNEIKSWIEIGFENDNRFARIAAYKFQDTVTTFCKKNQFNKKDIKDFINALIKHDFIYNFGIPSSYNEPFFVFNHDTNITDFAVPLSYDGGGIAIHVLAFPNIEHPLISNMQHLQLELYQEGNVKYLAGYSVLNELSPTGYYKTVWDLRETLHKPSIEIILSKPYNFPGGCTEDVTRNTNAFISLDVILRSGNLPKALVRTFLDYPNLKEAEEPEYFHALRNKQLRDLDTEKHDVNTYFKYMIRNPMKLAHLYKTWLPSGAATLTSIEDNFSRSARCIQKFWKNRNSVPKITEATQSASPTQVLSASPAT